MFVLERNKLKLRISGLTYTVVFSEMQKNILFDKTKPLNQQAGKIVLLRDLEAINVCLDAVYGKIVTCEQLRPVHPQTVALVKLCLDFKSDDLKIQSEVGIIPFPKNNHV